MSGVHHTAIKHGHSEYIKMETTHSRGDKLLKANKQGIVTDTFINNNHHEATVFRDTPLPAEIIQTRAHENKKDSDKRFLTLFGVPLAVLGAGAVASSVFAKAYKKKLNGQDLEAIKKNVFKDPVQNFFSNVKRMFTNKFEDPVIPPSQNMNEAQYSLFEALKAPSLKKMIGSIAVLTYTSAAFILKNTTDGIKEIWVKQKEADIQRDFQEKMIDIETRSFSGKKQIVRHLLDQETKSLVKLNKSRNISFKGNGSRLALMKAELFKPDVNPVEFFKRMENRSADNPPALQMIEVNSLYSAPETKKESKAVNEKTNKDEKQKSGINPMHIIAGIGTVAASVLLIKHTVKNLRSVSNKIDEVLNLEKQDFLKRLKGATTQSYKNTDEAFSHEKLAEDLFKRDIKGTDAENVLKKTNFDDETTNNVLEAIKEKNKIYANVSDIYGDQKGRPTMFAVFNEAVGWLYFAITKPNKLSSMIFGAFATSGGLAYAGSKAVEANKEVQVKKAGAQIDLDMHEKLIGVELKNFMRKKKAAYKPLVDDYNSYSAQNPEDKHGLKAKVNGIIDEIKNGPPFIYD